MGVCANPREHLISVYLRNANPAAAAEAGAGVPNRAARSFPLSKLDGHAVRRIDRPPRSKASAQIRVAGANESGQAAGRPDRLR